MSDREESSLERDINRPSEDSPLLPGHSRKSHGHGQFRSTLVKFFRPCLSEMVGVLLFVFITTMAVQDTATPPTGTPSATSVALAQGFTIALLVASFGDISGGHFNPAVTLGVSLGKRMCPYLAIGYMISQCVGGILGAACCRGVLSSLVNASSNDSQTVYSLINGGGHNLAPGVTVGQGIFCEFLLTIVLVLAVLMTAVDTMGQNIIAPLAIGFAVVVDIVAGIYVTGASMNPARSLGPAVVMSSFNTTLWTYHYVYWIGPALGATFAAAMYRFIFASSHNRLILKEE